MPEPEGDPTSPAEAHALNFDILAESLPQIVWITRPDGHNVYFNRRWSEYTGMTLEESVGWGWSLRLHPDDRERTERRWNEATSTGEAYEIEYRFRRADGTYRWFLARGLPHRDARGRIIRWFGTCTDIEDRKRAEEVVRGQGEFLRVTLSSIGDAVVVTDAEGRVNFLNPVARELCGWGDEAIGKPLEAVFQIVNEQSRAAVENPVAKVLREGRVVGLANHTILIARDGTERPIDDSAAPIRDESGAIRGVVLVFRDVSEQKAAERARAERNRLAEFEANVGIALTELRDLPEMLQGCCGAMVRYLDAAFARIWTLDEAGTVLELAASAGCYTHLDGPHARVPVGRFKIGRIAETREPHLTNEVREDPLVGDRDWATREGMIAFAGYPLEIEGRLLGVMAMFARRPLSRATLQSMATAAKAISLGIERKRVEVERSRLFGLEQRAREIAEASRAEVEAAGRAKDRFLAMLSHELRTPINPVLLTATAMLDDPSTPEEMRPTWRMIRDNLGLEARLIDDLLDVMRVVQGKMTYAWEVADAHGLVEKSVEIVRSEAYGKRIDLDIRLDASRSHVRADPARLTQAFWNLLRNSIKFTDDDGSIRVRTRDLDGRLVVEIADDGIGIEPGALARIFNAFEQAEDSITRRFGGLGLGLAITRSVVEAHGGTLTAASRGRGHGATFTIEIPTVKPASNDTGDPARAPIGARERNSFKILLVEDDPMTSRVMGTLLRNAGHEVATALSYDAALTLATPEFDLVVSDVGLPGRNGYDLMRELEASHGLKGIALTGFGMDEDVQKSREAGFLAHLTKPVDFAKLEETIQRFGAAVALRSSSKGGPMPG